MVLTGLVAGMADRVGPRTPMVVVLGLGTTGLGLAVLGGTASAAAIGVGVFALSYWCYLTLVGLQVVLSVPETVRGQALGGLYAAMWSGAAVGGALAALIDGWATVLSICALAWMLAGVIAARWFAGARGVQPTGPPRAAAVSVVDAPAVAR